MANLADLATAFRKVLAAPDDHRIVTIVWYAPPLVAENLPTLLLARSADAERVVTSGVLLRLEPMRAIVRPLSGSELIIPLDSIDLLDWPQPGEDLNPVVRELLRTLPAR